MQARGTNPERGFRCGPRLEHDEELKRLVYPTRMSAGAGFANEVRETGSTKEKGHG